MFPFPKTKTVSKTHNMLFHKDTSPNGGIPPDRSLPVMQLVHISRIFSTPFLITPPPSKILWSQLLPIIHTSAVISTPPMWNDIFCPYLVISQMVSPDSWRYRGSQPCGQYNPDGNAYGIMCNPHARNKASTSINISTSAAVAFLHLLSSSMHSLRFSLSIGRKHIRLTAAPCGDYGKPPSTPDMKWQRYAQR